MPPPFDFNARGQASRTGGTTLLVMHELYPANEALDRAIAGIEGGMGELFEQPDELIVTLGASVSPAQQCV
jgi:hypothetical protein